MSRVNELIAQHCPDGVPYQRLGEVLRIKNGKDHKGLADGDIPVYGSGGIIRYVDTASASGPSVLIPRKGSLGNIFYVDEPFWVVDTIFRTEIDTSLVEPKFIYYLLLTMKLGEMNQAGGVPSQTQTVLNALRLPVPPLEVQRAIVEVLDTFSKLEAELEAELEVRKLQYEHYRAELLVVPDDSKWSTLGELCTIETGKLNANAARENGEYAFFTTAQEVSRIDSYRWDAEALLVAGNANVGDVKHYVGKFDAYQRTYVLTNFSDRVDVKFLFYVLKNGLQRYLEGRTNSAAMTYIVLGTLRDLPVALVSLEEQRHIVEALDRFDALVNDFSVGLPAELAARRQQYEYYRDKLLTFKELEISA